MTDPSSPPAMVSGRTRTIVIFVEVLLYVLVARGLYWLCGWPFSVGAMALAVATRNVIALELLARVTVERSDG